MTQRRRNSDDMDAPEQIAFSRRVASVGTLALRALDPAGDAEVIQRWVDTERARYWGMQGMSVARVAEAYRAIVQAAHSMAYIGLQEGRPAFLTELYHPGSEPVGKCYPVRDTDRGMHILVAPPEQRISGFTWHVFRLVMDFIFSEPGVERVVVEPDVNNADIHALNRRAGFEYHRRITLPDKTAYLATCTREQYRAAITD